MAKSWDLCKLKQFPITIHVDADGNIVASMPPEPEDVWTQNPLNEAVLESVEVADAIENEWFLRECMLFIFVYNVCQN